MAPDILRNMRAIASLRAPVPLVRPPTVPARSPAGRPGRGAVKAIGAISGERSEPTDDILGGWPGSTISVRLVAGICYFDRQGCDRRMLAQACRSDGKSWIRYQGEVSVAGWRRRSLQIPFGWLAPRHVPAYGPPATICGRTHRWRRSAAGPAGSARDHAKCSRCPSLRCGWLSSR